MCSQRLPPLLVLSVLSSSSPPLLCLSQANLACAPCGYGLLALVAVRWQMLKTWYDLVQEAREAGIGVGKKAVQLWNVGAGLPLDAIKSGSINGWRCSYDISDLEV